MTSGLVRREFESILNDPATDYTKITRPELKTCCDLFASLVEKRNALIHAHPITDTDGSQILNYQTGPDRPLPDMKWPIVTVDMVHQEFDAAACNANALLYRLLKN
jgi:hypothetical protein